MKTILKPTRVLVALGVMLTLAGCGKASQTDQANQQVVAQYAKKKITQQDFYQALKAEPSAKQVLANLLIYGAMKDAYGNKIDETKVTAAYKSYQSRYGNQFAAYLEENGYTKKTFKQTLRLNYLSEAALKAQIKPTTAQLKDAWKTYQPKITVQHILTTSEDTAKTVIAQLQQGADFAELAQKYSVDNTTASTGGKKAAFDSTDKNVDSTFKDAAYKLKDGEFTTTPVKTTSGYEVIQMIKHPAKGTFKASKAALTAVLYQKWESSTTVMKNVISQVLKDENVKIKDKDLQSALNAYKGTTTSGTATTK